MYQIEESLRGLAAQVIDEHEDVSALMPFLPRIAFLYCDAAKKANRKVVYADTQKVDEKMKALTNLDFIITFYAPNCEELDDERMEILMHHELKHCGYDGDRCMIIPHDVEDFRDIIEAHGVDWSTKGGLIP